MSSQHRKSACALAWNVEAMADRFGIASLGFLTLTFAAHVLCPKEAQRRFNSLATHVLRSRYRAHVRVMERQKSGRIHYHLLIVCTDELRPGADFDAFAQGDYRTACAALRAEWAFWRSTAPAYGFGRTELLPVRSTSEGIARYVGKYISKHVGQREERDRGVRLVEYSREARMASTRFAWATPNAATWRRKVALFAKIVEGWHGISPIHFHDLAVVLGPRWAHRYRQFIAELPEVSNA